MTGGQATTTIAGLYDVIGQLRGQVLGLQDWVRAMLGETVPTQAPK